MDSSSDTSSLGKEYDDGVYDKIDTQVHYSEYTPRSQSPTREPTSTAKLPIAILACLVLLFVFCFIGILVSGLHFGHRISDLGASCLGQSWILFSVRKATHHSFLYFFSPPQPYTICTCSCGNTWWAYTDSNGLCVTTVASRPAVHCAARSSRTKRRTSQPTTTRLAESATFGRHCDCAAGCHSLGHLAGHCRRGRVQGSSPRVVCESGGLCCCDVSFFPLYCLSFSSAPPLYKSGDPRALAALLMWIACLGFAEEAGLGWGATVSPLMGDSSSWSSDFGYISTSKKVDLANM